MYLFSSFVTRGYFVELAQEVGLHQGLLLETRPAAGTGAGVLVEPLLEALSAADLGALWTHERLVRLLVADGAPEELFDAVALGLEVRVGHLSSGVVDHLVVLEVVVLFLLRGVQVFADEVAAHHVIFVVVEDGVLQQLVVVLVVRSDVHEALVAVHAGRCLL